MPEDVVVEERNLDIVDVEGPPPDGNDDEGENGDEDALTITIDGEEYEVRRVLPGDYLPLLEIEGSNMEFYVAENPEEAGKAAREYWKDMVENDPREFTAMVGEETQIQWGLGQWAGPGSAQVKSLEEWLDLWLDTPEEQWARYDNEECAVGKVSEALVEELGFTPTVAYRWN